MTAWELALGIAAGLTMFVVSVFLILLGVSLILVALDERRKR